MANPFNFEKADSKFVKTEVSKDFREREMKITKLTITRQWLLVCLVIYSFFQLILLTLDPQRFFADAFNFVCFIGLLGSFSLLNQQIKYLKTLQESMAVQRIDP